MSPAMTCASGVDLLTDYLEDALPSGVRADLDAHVAGCPRCTAFLASYLASSRILRRATLVDPPADLESKLRELVRGRWGR